MRHSLKREFIFLPASRAWPCLRQTIHFEEHPQGWREAQRIGNRE